MNSLGLRRPKMPRGRVSALDELRGQVFVGLSDQKIATPASGDGLPPFGVETQGDEATFHRGLDLLHRLFNHHRRTLGELNYS